MELIEILKWLGWYFFIGFILPMTIAFCVQFYLSAKLSNLWATLSAIPASIFSWLYCSLFT